MIPISADEPTRILDAGGSSLDPSDEALRGLPPGSRVGAYRVESELGIGGVGRVYLAEQLEPVRRRVALKIARATGGGFDARGFVEEHQVLASMSHPGIAQVFDAGTLDDGRPWLVMEYIDGDSISGYCAAHALSTPARVALLARVARSIEHAHQRMLMHLDLKPSNILVSEVDARPMPRVIDFGAARIRGDRGVADSVTGTLAYMAPEQADLACMLDSRADVFSLGAILYELVSGRRFREPASDDREDFASLRARLAEPVPIRLSRAGDGAPGGLRRRELEAILRRATAPERDRRYSSAAELATDLERWLERRPVAAMPDRPGYRLRCLLARQALPIALAALTLTALLTGLVGTGMGLQEAREQRRVAEKRQADLEQLVQFQQQMLGRVDVNQLSGLLVERMAESARNLALRDGGTEAEADRAASDSRATIERLGPVDAARDLLVEGVLGQAGALIEREYARGDRIEAALRVSLGETLTRWQAYDLAEVQIERARAIHRELGAPADAEVLRAEVEALKLHWWQQQYPEAQEIAMVARPRAEAVLGPEHDLTLYLLRAEAVMAGNLGEGARAIEMFERLLERLVARHGPDHPETLQIEGDLLYSLRQQSGTRCSNELADRYRSHLRRTEQLQGPAARTHAISSLNFAGCALAEADYEEAIVRYRAAAETARSVLGERHTITLIALNDLAHTLLLMGRDSEVESMLDSFEENQRLVYGEDSHMLFYPRSYRLQIAVLRGDAARALPEITTLIDAATAHPQTPPMLIGWLWNIRSGAEETLGRLDEAVTSAQASLGACLGANADQSRLCLAEQAALVRIETLAGRPPDRSVLDELAVEASALRHEDPVRAIVAWLHYSRQLAEGGQDRRWHDELAWLLDTERDRLHPVLRAIREDMEALEAGVTVQP